MTVRKRAALPSSEHQLQSALCTYLELMARPEVLWFAIPNGGKRHIAVAVRLKKEGARRGVPDMAFCLPDGQTAWLELKIKGGSLSQEQRAFRDQVLFLGHRWGVAKTIDEAIEYLTSVGALRSHQRS